MKKFAFIYLLLFGFAYSEIADVSFVMKGGYSPLGFYKQNLTVQDGEDLDDKTTVSNTFTANLELHSRSKSLENFYYGAGLGYIGSGTLADSIGGSDKLGVDYFPIYFLLQYEPESEHYFGFLMYFSLRGGISYERDQGRISDNAGFANVFSTPSPYGGLSWGFEKENFMLEAFYDFNIGASANITPIGDIILMQTRRIGLSLGYRINSGYR